MSIAIVCALANGEAEAGDCLEAHRPAGQVYAVVKNRDPASNKVDSKVEHPRLSSDFHKHTQTQADTHTHTHTHTLRTH